MTTIIISEYNTYYRLINYLEIEFGEKIIKLKKMHYEIEKYENTSIMSLVFKCKIGKMLETKASKNINNIYVYRICMP